MLNTWSIKIGIHNLETDMVEHKARLHGLYYICMYIYVRATRFDIPHVIV